MNRVETSITGPDDDGIARVRDLLDELALANRLPTDPVSDMQVALDEILSNTLRNGFSDGLPHRADVTLSVDSQTLTAESANEQGTAGLTACTPEEFALGLSEEHVARLRELLERRQGN